MDSDLPFGYTHREKVSPVLDTSMGSNEIKRHCERVKSDERSHAQMELEGSSSPTWSNLNHLSVSREPSASASHPHHSVLHLSSSMPSAPPRRFPGDGFDYRRPVTSSNVIDLTSEDAGPSTVPRDSHRSSGRPARPPRFGREIIDVDEDDARPVATSPGSPEIQFVSSRPIGPGSRPTSPSIGRNNAEEDEVEFVSANPLPESRRRRNVELDFMFTMLDDVELQDRVPHLRAQVERRATAERDRRRVETRFNRRVADLRAGRAGQGPHAPPRRGRGHIHMGFLTPQLNFHAVGFDLGLDFGDSDEGPAPPPPTYNAPEKAPEGFTRSPQELDVLVCPNCGDDLCVGDSEQKRQVWIVKQCGHVYCGECTANRSIKKSAKGKEKQAPPRPRPFKECVVEGCGKRLMNKSHMIQVFL